MPSSIKYNLGTAETTSISTLRTFSQICPDSWTQKLRKHTLKFIPRYEFNDFGVQKRLRSDLGPNLRIFEPKDLRKKRLNSGLNFKKIGAKIQEKTLEFRPRPDFKDFWAQRFRKKPLKFRPRSEFQNFGAKIQQKNA